MLYKLGLVHSLLSLGMLQVLQDIIEIICTYASLQKGGDQIYSTIAFVSRDVVFSVNWSQSLSLQPALLCQFAETSVSLTMFTCL